MHTRIPYRPPLKQRAHGRASHIAAIVALAEMGDKTQLLAILLATRFGRPLPIIAGIFVATVANHFLAALAGSQAAAILDGQWFRYAIAVSFVAMAIWTLIPDKIDDVQDKPARFGAFVATTVAFFLVEMGDKTQIATIALGARFHDVVAVTMGTTAGMMIANVPAVYFGQALLRHVPLKVVRMIAASLFLVIGLWLFAQTASLIKLGKALRRSGEGPRSWIRETNFGEGQSPRHSIHQHAQRQVQRRRDFAQSRLAAIAHAGFNLRNICRLRSDLRGVGGLREAPHLLIAIVSELWRRAQLGPKCYDRQLCLPTR